jgi:hypothetical protein
MRQAPRKQLAGEFCGSEKPVFESGLWVIVLEMFCALGLGVFIVWWTWPRKKGERKSGAPNPPAAAQKDKPE